MCRDLDFNERRKKKVNNLFSTFWKNEGVG